MCGIIGATGATEDGILGLLLAGLERLEYRGYDSAGVALECGGDLYRARAATGTRSLEDLRKIVENVPAGVTAGIGHTRWATHGHPTEVNAHPHLDCTGGVAVVHNGIIENWRELAARLRDGGHVLASDTDTEVYAHLVEEEMAAGASLANAVRATLRDVRGAFALAVVAASEPGTIVAARRVSPLVVGLGDGDEPIALLASDIPALLGHTRRFWVLDDDQVVELRPGSLRVTTLAGKEVEPSELHVDWDMAAAEKGGYPDFMGKEIHEQPRAVADTLLGRLLPDGTIGLDELRITPDDLRDIDKVFIVACGTSYHAGMVAKYAIEHWARLPTEIDIASEFRYRDPVLDRRTLVVGVSQSGETLDTLQAVTEARQWDARVLVISNVVDSSMARVADGVLYTHAGPEVGVASTKTHLSQIVALELLALYLAQLRGTLPADDARHLLAKMEELPGLIEMVLGREEAVAAVAGKFTETRDFFFLGRHVGFPVALEGALKLKELSYLRAEGYPAGELKHGPIALIEPGTVVVAVATRTRLWDKMMSNIAEVRSRGATVLLVANDGDEETAAEADEVLWVPRTEPLLAPVVDVIPLQLFAYHLAALHGLDVDRPRNLAKTVTVE
jgi:glucosamine--fructose-6-phosphate aminotransferase (isomerizing)